MLRNALTRSRKKTSASQTVHNLFCYIIIFFHKKPSRDHISLCSALIFIILSSLFPHKCRFYKNIYFLHHRKLNTQTSSSPNFPFGGREKKGGKRIFGLFSAHTLKQFDRQTFLLSTLNPGLIYLIGPLQGWVSNAPGSQIFLFEAHSDAALPGGHQG